MIPVLAGADDTVVPIYLKSRNYRKLPEQQAEYSKIWAGLRLRLASATTGSAAAAVQHGTESAAELCRARAGADRFEESSL